MDIASKVEGNTINLVGGWTRMTLTDALRELGGLEPQLLGDKAGLLEAGEVGRGLRIRQQIILQQDRLLRERIEVIR